jgi:hypothetical protein
VLLSGAFALWLNRLAGPSTSGFAHELLFAPGLAVVDAYFLGSSATEVGGALWDLYLKLDSATTEEELAQASNDLSKVLAGPIAEGLLKVLLLGAGKLAGEFHKNYTIEVPKGLANGSQPLSIGALPIKIKKRDGSTVEFPRDFSTKGTKDWSAAFKSEGEARAFARTKLGKNPIEVEPGKWRSADGKWQYRAKPVDLNDNHVHLEELNPVTGEVLQNLHLRWKEGTGR